MIPKSEIEATLVKHFGASCSEEKIHAVSGELANLEMEWEEMDIKFQDLGLSMSVQCSDICFLAEHLLAGDKIRFFRKRELKDDDLKRPAAA